jgi:predicted ATP-grasp superfamily ATP-dependent carboligase
MTAKSPAVVIGLGLNALGTLRALDAAGVSTYVITPGVGDPCEATRHGKKIPCPAMNTDPDALIQCLLKLRERFDRPAVLFPAGDLSLELVSNARELLAGGYLFPFPDKRLVDLIIDKNRFYRFANERDIAIPTTFFPDSLADVAARADGLRYPCLIKPAVAGMPWRQKGWKIMLANDRRELLARYQVAAAVQPLLVVQEVIEGPDSALHFSLTYADRQSECRAMFTGRKLRQYVPHYGISSLAESRWYPEVDQLTRDILRTMGYSGYASIEFKKDARNGRFYVIEVTGRTWYPHALSEICGVNLPWLAWASLTGEPLPSLPKQREGVKWMDEFNDLRSAWQHHREGNLGFRDWISSYRGELHLGHYRRGDAAPFRALLRQQLTRSVKMALYPAYRVVKRITGASANRS